MTNETRVTVLGRSVEVADSMLQRLRGYLGRPAPMKGEGLLLVPCVGVHMYGLRFALDVVFLDRDGRVVALYPNLTPSERTRWHRDAACALEVPVGTIAESGTRLGDVVLRRPISEPEIEPAQPRVQPDPVAGLPGRESA